MPIPDGEKPQAVKNSEVALDTSPKLIIGLRSGLTKLFRLMLTLDGLVREGHSRYWTNLIQVRTCSLLSENQLSETCHFLK